jgi:flagellar hook-length control protein FliK
VVITLSAYTQPPPIDTAVALSELPQIRETNQVHEYENEQSAFEEILAGMLHETGEEEQSTAEETQEISLEDSSGVQIDAAAFAGEIINFVKPEAMIIVREEISGIEFSEIGLSESEIAKEYPDILSDTEDMQIIAKPPAGEDAELPQDFFDIGNFERLADFQREAVASAADSAQKTLPAETRGKEIKKDGSFLQAENIEIPLAGSRSKEAASLQKETEKDGRGKLGETQNRGRRDKISFEVRDMRSSGADAQNNAMQFKAGAQIAERVQDAPVKEITLELRLPEQAQSSAQTTWEAKASTALENMLARELHQNFNGDIVRHASMALHDGGEGVIKLALKPESLGNVKIHLKMSENKITGHIVVESEEALNAFKKEIASLEQAFKESGFTNAELNLSLAADQRNADWQEQKAPSFLPGIAASRYDESYEAGSLSIVDVFFGQRLGSVNMLA